MLWELSLCKYSSWPSGWGAHWFIVTRDAVWFPRLRTKVWKRWTSSSELFQLKNGKRISISARKVKQVLNSSQNLVWILSYSTWPCRQWLAFSAVWLHWPEGLRKKMIYDIFVHYTTRLFLIKTCIMMLSTYYWSISTIDRGLSSCVARLLLWNDRQRIGYSNEKRPLEANDWFVAVVRLVGFYMASQSVTRFVIPPSIFLSSAADVSAYGNTVTLNPGEMWERHTRLAFFKYLMFEIEVHSEFQSCNNLIYGW